MLDDVDVQWFGRSEGVEQGAGKVEREAVCLEKEIPFVFSANLPHGTKGLATAPPM
jgi:hypothetical protein